MKRVLLIVLLFALVGCIHFPSVCDRIDEPSVLCDLADKMNVRLEEIGNGLLILNAAAIGSGQYTNTQAREVITDLKMIVESPVSWILFRIELQKKTAKYPGLYEIANIYADYFTSLDPMGDFDRATLIDWFTKIEKILEG